MPLSIIWFIAFILLLVVECITIGLVSIWFAVGSLAAFVVSLFTDSIVIQLIVFIIVSVLSLIITKPLIRKFKVTEVTPTNSDMVIGKVGDIIKAIDSNHYGEIKVFGKVWTAYSDEKIEVGSKAKVLKIDGVKLIVQKEEK